MRARRKDRAAYRSATLQGSQSRMPRQRTSPIMKSRPTRALSSIPRVIRLRRCSSGRSGGSKDSQTSASMRVSALPGSPEGKVPVPVTWRLPARPRPVSACTAGQAPGWFPRGCGDPDPFDRAVRGGRAWPAWQRERDVGGGDDEPVLDPVAADLRVACGIPGNPGGDAVHDDIAGLPACGRADLGEPGSRPRERRGFGDAGDTQAKPSQPARDSPASSWIGARGQLREPVQRHLEDRGQAGEEGGDQRLPARRQRDFFHKTASLSGAARAREVTVAGDSRSGYRKQTTARPLCLAPTGCWKTNLGYHPAASMIARSAPSEPLPVAR